MRVLSLMLREARIARDLTQEQVAHAADVAVSTYARLERDATGLRSNPTLRTIARIGGVLGVDSEQILGPDASISEQATLSGKPLSARS